MKKRGRISVTDSGPAKGMGSTVSGKYAKELLRQDFFLDYSEWRNCPNCKEEIQFTIQRPSFAKKEMQHLGFPGTITAKCSCSASNRHVSEYSFAAIEALQEEWNLTQARKIPVKFGF